MRRLKCSIPNRTGASLPQLFNAVLGRQRKSHKEQVEYYEIQHFLLFRRMNLFRRSRQGMTETCGKAERSRSGQLLVEIEGKESVGNGGKIKIKRSFVLTSIQVMIESIT